MFTKIIFIVSFLIFVGGAYFGVQIILRSSRDTIREADIEAINIAFEKNASKSQEDVITYKPLNEIDFPKGVPKDPLNNSEKGLVYTFKIGDSKPTTSSPSNPFYSYILCAKLEYKTGNARDEEGMPSKSNTKSKFYCQKSPQNI